LTGATPNSVGVKSGTVQEENRVKTTPATPIAKTKREGLT